MKKALKLFGIIALVAVVGFSMAACGGAGGGGGGGGDDGGGSGTTPGDNSGSKELWRIKKSIHIFYDNGVASTPSETLYNYSMYRYTSDTDYEFKRTNTSGTSSSNDHFTRNGQTLVLETETSTSTSTSITTYDLTTGNRSRQTSTSTSDSATSTQTSTSTTTYDPATGLELQYSYSVTFTNKSTNVTTTITNEYSYTIQLLSDSGGVKTYKQSYSSTKSNGVSQDFSTLGYTEYKIQNGKILEGRHYDKDGVYTYSSEYHLYTNNAIILAKLGDPDLMGAYGSIKNPSSTVEVLSDSATELVIRIKLFYDNELKRQNDYYYEKVN